MKRAKYPTKTHEYIKIHRLHRQRDVFPSDKAANSGRPPINVVRTCYGMYPPWTLFCRSATADSTQTRTKPNTSHGKRTAK